MPSIFKPRKLSHDFLPLSEDKPSRVTLRHNSPLNLVFKLHGFTNSRPQFSFLKCDAGGQFWIACLYFRGANWASNPHRNKQHAKKEVAEMAIAHLRSNILTNWATHLVKKSVFGANPDSQRGWQLVFDWDHLRKQATSIALPEWKNASEPFFVVFGHTQTQIAIVQHAHDKGRLLKAFFDSTELDIVMADLVKPDVEISEAIKLESKMAEPVKPDVEMVEVVKAEYKVVNPVNLNTTKVEVVKLDIEMAYPVNPDAQVAEVVEANTEMNDRGKAVTKRQDAVELDSDIVVKLDAAMVKQDVNMTVESDLDMEYHGNTEPDETRSNDVSTEDTSNEDTCSEGSSSAESSGGEEGLVEDSGNEAGDELSSDEDGSVKEESDAGDSDDTSSSDTTSSDSSSSEASSDEDSDEGDDGGDVKVTDPYSMRAAEEGSDNSENFMDILEEELEEEMVNRSDEEPKVKNGKDADGIAGLMKKLSKFGKD
ncbi:hypothetical protein VTL71DRAFT_9904 [Oculimacula yallundae]|uniref:Uncharacterized protein n=1 Tax=Oculimacula yallundae TaxID=86028 RepID=A0ABR4BQU6_9HELO